MNKFTALERYAITSRFTAEEMNLMCIFDTASREVLRNEIMDGLHYVEEAEMIGLFGSTLEKLDNLTDEEFAAIGFYAAEETDDDLLPDDLQ